MPIASYHACQRWSLQDKARADRALKASVNSLKPAKVNTMLDPLSAPTEARPSIRLTNPPQGTRQIVLVFQGGGALGAYQAGVYQALHEARIEPDWIIGTSIGAIDRTVAKDPGRPRRFLAHHPLQAAPHGRCRACAHKRDALLR
jgi:hypothetical protein